jgi:hypothetical protein
MMIALSLITSLKNGPTKVIVHVPRDMYDLSTSIENDHIYLSDGHVWNLYWQVLEVRKMRYSQYVIFVVAVVLVVVMVAADRLNMLVEELNAKQDFVVAVVVHVVNGDFLQTIHHFVV